MVDRAAAGGGRSTPINPGSFQTVNYTIGQTYGNSGQGADWFGPGTPMSPQAPPEVAGRAFDFPQGVNILTSTRPYQPISYETLRAFADSYDILRLIIETRKDAMERLTWAIQFREAASVKISPQVRNRIKTLTKFFMKPDGEHGWSDWLRMLLEDLFVIDAATLHRRRLRGGKLISLDQIDGATMRRVLDDWGRTPEGESEVAYQQILKGMPAIDYNRNEIFFRPRNLRVHKIYGYSPVEQILMTINIALRRQVFQLNFFTEGNVPASLIGVPETWTPDQIRVFQEWFDSINSGNLAERRKARFVPNAVGKTYIPTQETELFGQAEEWLARVCCFAFSVSPMPFIKMMNRSTSETAQQEADATGIIPIKNWVKSVIDETLAEDFDAADMEFVWKGDDEVDPVKRQQITSGYLHDGLITVNEGRVDSGRDPYDDPRFDQPMFMSSYGLAPLIVDPNDPLDQFFGQKGGGGLLPTATGGKVPGAKATGKPATEPPKPSLPTTRPAATRPAGKVSKVLDTVEDYIASGDADGLAAFMKSLQQGDSLNGW